MTYEEYEKFKIYDLTTQLLDILWKMSDCNGIYGNLGLTYVESRDIKFLLEKIQNNVSK